MTFKIGDKANYQYYDGSIVTFEIVSYVDFVKYWTSCGHLVIPYDPGHAYVKDHLGGIYWVVAHKLMPVNGVKEIDFFSITRQTIGK